MISEDVIVHDSDGKEIESQLVPLVDAYVTLRNYHVKAYLGQTPVETPKYWLAFAVSVPPLGFSSYIISNVKRPGLLFLKRHSMNFFYSPSQQNRVERVFFFFGCRL